MPLPWSELCDPTDGYSPRWGGTEEFIEDITYRIWEQGDLEVIKETYSDTCPVITLSGTCEGVETILKKRTDLLNQFPDRTLYPRDILWNGNNTAGYHSSHLISTKCTYHHSNWSDSEYSWASHLKQARIWVIAHRVVKDGLVTKEWVVSDSKSLYQQLRVNTEDVATRFAEKWLRDKMDPVKSEFCHLSWLAAEFQRVQNEGSIGGETRLNLQNITPAQRPMYQFLGQRVAGLYRSVWGPEGMGSRDKFEELVKLLYHPHARFESPQTNGTDCTGWTELTCLYDTFILGGLQGKEVTITLDWVIIKHGHDRRKILTNGATPNSWRYPCPEDVNLQVELESKFANSDQVSESFTVSIRWCLVGYQKQENPDILVPLVLLAESHLDCVGFRVIRDITVYDRVAVDAQVKLTTEVVHNVQF